jgi:hypothetical protein
MNNLENNNYNYFWLFLLVKILGFLDFFSYLKGFIFFWIFN